jgi:EmrB/QacA subfamily drug resistance transporter
MKSLIVFRVFQGIGAGIIMPIMQTILIRYSGGQNLGKLMALISIPTAIIPILGPTVGGLIVNYLPWRWIFAINIPLCIAAFLFSIAMLPHTEPVDKEQRLDIIGLLLLAAAFCTLIFGISELSAAGLNTAIIKIAIGIVLLITYCVYVLLGKQTPLLDVRIFRQRNFSAATALIFVFGMVSTGTLFVLPLFFQQVHKMTPIVAGLLLAPQGVGMLITREMAGNFTERYGAKPIAIAGVLITFLGTVPLAFLENSANIVLPAIILLVRGGGLGLMSIANMVAIYDGLDEKETAQGTTATRIFQQIGGAFGTALLAIVLSHRLAAVGSADAFEAFSTVFWWAAAFTAISVIPAICLNGKRGGKAAFSRG